MAHPIRILPLALAAAAALQPVCANEAHLDFNIPPQPLGSALNAYADKANVQMSYPAALAANLQTQGINGPYTQQQALKLLLAGTGINARATANGTVTLEKVAVQSAAPPATPVVSKPAAASATALPLVTVTGKTGYDSNDPYSKDYAVTNASTATKTDTPIMQTPMSIQVVPKSIIDDQQAVRLEDALKNVSGVSNDSSYGSANVYDSFIIRGFTINSGIYRNGLRLAEQAHETAGLDRIEVLKGPASVLYGRTEAGGMINIVTKRPLEETYYAVEQQIGSYDLYRTTVDATGPINNDRSLLYRLNLAYQDANSFRDFTSKERMYIAPSLTWRPTDKTEWHVNFEYRNDTFRGDMGIPALGNRPAPVPISFSTNDNIGKERLEAYTVGSELSHKLTDDWKITSRFMFSQSNYQWNTLWQGGIIPGTTLVDRAFLIKGPGQTDYYATNLDLSGTFQTFGIQHKALIGFDYYKKERYDADNYWDYRPDLIPPVDYLNPVHGNVSIPENFTPNAYWRDNSEWHGFYFQDQMTFFDTLHLLFGGRHDHADQGAGFSGTADVTLDKSSVDAFNPRVGILYQVLPWLSVYGQYVESLGAANSGLTFSGNVLAPETAQQYEAGLKTEWLGGRLFSSLVYFHLTKQNTKMSDPDHPLFSLAIGEARSQGLEWDISGRLTDDLSIIGTYTYTDAIVTKNDPATLGKRLINTPEHAASLWGKYDLTANITLGTGVYLASEREGDVSNTYQLPGYVRWDMMAAYHQPIGESKLTVQLNVNNVLDKRYYASSSSNLNQIHPGMPLVLMGSVKLEY